MPANYVKIASVTVGSGGASSMTFSSIPSTYTDLLLKVSIRTNRNDGVSVDDVLQIQPNGSSSNLTTRNLRGNGSNVTSGNNTTWSGGYITSDFATSNTFGNLEVYIPNYAGSNSKSWSVDAVSENNGTEAFAELKAVLWSQSTAISSLVLVPLYGTAFKQYSTATLYGIKNASTAATKKATGGDIIVTSGGYTYHAFKTSGTFTPTQSLSCDVLVVAGGGGTTAASNAGGGGAGGLLGFTGQSLTATGYTVTVGAGGAAGSQGANSQFGSLTASVGGGFGSGANPAGSGGSGAGGAATAGFAGGSATSGQGFAGGTGANSGSGGGGGSGQAGANGTTGTGGIGGDGTTAYSSWGLATLTGQNVGGTVYYAGGGGGWQNSPRGGYGGGATQSGAGTANTGGGGGGYGSGTGGSGIVIVRYAV